jgi:hypothetical protein
MLGQEDVRRFDVPVEDRPLMRVVHGAGDLGHQRGHGARFRLEPRDVPGEVPTLDDLHAEVGLIVGLADLVDRDDVRVVELGDRLGLVPEPAQFCRAGQRTGLDQLEGHQAIELVLAGPVDDAHAASSDLLEQLVLAEESGRPAHRPRRRAARRCRWDAVGRGFLRRPRRVGLVMIRDGLVR